MNITNNPDANGVVTKINQPNIYVRTDGKTVRCIMPTRACGQRNAENVNTLIVGDQVRLNLFPDGSGCITQVLPRRNELSRRSAVPMPGAHAHEQLIAANLDLAMPVFAAANPAPRWHLLDRYLVLAEMVGIPALICITKGDLAYKGNGKLDDDLAVTLEEYRRIGFPSVITCALDGSGLEPLREALRGKVAIMLGKSGVGKSSLLNALQPCLELRVNDVNAVTGKGRHTTTVSEMYHLGSGGAIVDTPGIREFGLWNIPADNLDYLFPEMRSFLGLCRFGKSCRHVEEPGCAVRRSVMTGTVSPYRYHSYLKLLEEGARQ